MLSRCQTCVEGFQTDKNLEDHIDLLNEEDLKQFVLYNEGETQDFSEEDTDGDSLEGKTESSPDQDLIPVIVHLPEFSVCSDLSYNAKSSTKHRPAVENEFKCHICQKLFAKAKHLKQHIKRHKEKELNPFNNGVPELNLQVKENSSDIGNKVSKLHRCHICEKSFSIGRNLRRHMKIHKKDYPNAINIEYSKLNKNEDTSLDVGNLEQKQGKVHKCDICQRILASTRNLQRHMKVHNKEEPMQIKTEPLGNDESENSKLDHEKLKSLDMVNKFYRCEVCEKLLASVENLKRHMKIHEQEESVQMKTEPPEYNMNDDQNIADRGLETMDMKDVLHKCNICLKVFTRLSYLQHSKIHNNENPNKSRNSLPISFNFSTKPFKCDLCNQSFSQSDLLIKHVMTHKDEGAIKDNLSNKSINQHSVPFDRSDDDDTDISDTDGLKQGREEIKEHKCVECDNIYKTSEELLKHLMTHTSLNLPANEGGESKLSPSSQSKNLLLTEDGEEMRTCPVCKKSMDQSREVTKHLMSHTSQRPYKCPVCDQAFPGFNKQKKHLLTHADDEYLLCSVCKEQLDNSEELREHLLTHISDRQYACVLCEKSFAISSKLKKHYMTHTGEKPFKCDFCNISFCQSGHLKKHLLRHTGEKPFDCDQCDKSFSRNELLKKHLLTHTGEQSKRKTLKCDVCDKMFPSNYYLKIHLMTHTGEKPHKCDICKKSFTDTSNLRSHMRTHTGEKPNKCDLCDKSFLRASQLRLHLQAHSGKKPFKCGLCGRGFFRTTSLRRHLEKKACERNLRCDVCEKLFIHLSALKNHIKMHSHERPFSCGECGKTFVQAGSLKNHLETHNDKYHADVVTVTDPGLPVGV